jgi:hypothetical protein
MTCSPETPVDFQQSRRRYIPEHKTLHNHRSENLESYTLYIFTNLYFVREIILKNAPQMLKKCVENITGALYNKSTTQGFMINKNNLTWLLPIIPEKNTAYIRHTNFDMLVLHEMWPRAT